MKNEYIKKSDSRIWNLKRKREEFEGKLEEIDKEIQKETEYRNSIDSLIFPITTCKGNGDRDEHYMHTTTIEGLGSAEQWDRGAKLHLNLEQAKHYVNNEDKYHKTVLDYIDGDSRKLIVSLEFLRKYED